MGFISDLSQRRDGAGTGSEEQLRSLMANTPGSRFAAATKQTGPCCSSAMPWWHSRAGSPRIFWRPYPLQPADGAPEDVPRLWDGCLAAIGAKAPLPREVPPGGQAGQHALGVESGRPMLGDDGQVLWIDGVIMDMTFLRAAQCRV